MRFLRCADSGLLVELDDLDAVQALHAALSDAPPEGVVDLVPAARTLLLQLDPRRADVAAIEAAVRAVEPRRSDRAALFITYPEASTASRTRCRSSARTCGRLLRTFDTVIVDTPASLATSVMVTIADPSLRLVPSLPVCLSARRGTHCITV